MYLSKDASRNTRFFDMHGFVLLPSFATRKETQEMKEKMQNLIETEWCPSTEKTTIFRTDEKQVESQGSSDYFLSSSNKVHYFLEKDAVNKNGSIKVSKSMALNKVGHGLHYLPPFLN